MPAGATGQLENYRRAEGAEGWSQAQGLPGEQGRRAGEARLGLGPVPYRSADVVNDDLDDVAADHLYRQDVLSCHIGLFERG